MNPLHGARTLAVGRVAFGVALIAFPERIARGWVGELAERPAVGSLVRSIGARDVVIGLIALHTAGHAEVGPRWQRTCAMVDCADILATAAGRSEMPSSGVLGTFALAGGAAGASLYFSRQIAHAQ